MSLLDYFFPRRDDEIIRLLQQIQQQGDRLMATTAELVGVANAAAQGITDLAKAIDDLEAKITSISGIPPAAQADIDKAVATLQAAATAAATAVADAADGVDEATLVVPSP